MLRSTVRIATLVVLVIAAPARAQQVTAVTHAVLIDGNGGEPVPDAVVVIRGSVIEVVGPARSVLVPRSANVIDAHGRTLMPGLADMHVHLMGGWDGEHVDMLGYAGARSERVGGKLKQSKLAESGESAISICSPTRSAGGSTGPPTSSGC